MRECGTVGGLLVFGVVLQASAAPEEAAAAPEEAAAAPEEAAAAPEEAAAAFVHVNLIRIDQRHDRQK